jgi:tRNA threonylcarbamoyl adenosine modification protein (Sua5/YciO/YrdC/YwlC family)
MLIKLYENNPSQREVDRIVRVLREGGVIIYPTDTVYALGCDALNTRAVERICKLKHINPQKAHLSIVCSDLSGISGYAKVDNAVFKLMKRNLPGAFTFILNATTGLPKIYKNRREVGIRVPDNPIARMLVRELGNPVLSASVRTRDDVLQYATDPELMEEEYDGRVDAVVDGGYGGLEPSTVVDCTGDEIRVVRQGKGELVYG